MMPPVNSYTPEPRVTKLQRGRLGDRTRAEYITITITITITPHRGTCTHAHNLNVSRASQQHLRTESLDAQPRGMLNVTLSDRHDAP